MISWDGADEPQGAHTDHLPNVSISSLVELGRNKYCILLQHYHGQLKNPSCYIATLMTEGHWMAKICS